MQPRTVPFRSEDDKKIPQSYFDNVSPQAQTFIKRLIGFSVSAYICRVIYTSPDVRDVLSGVFSWGKRRLCPAFHFEGDSNFQRDIATFNLLLGLPSNVRGRILTKVPWCDLKNVRLVCRRLRWDIDHVIGVHAFIDSRCPPSYNWFKTVVIRKCTVNHLKNLRDWDFLLKPQLLTILKMNDLCPITPGILSLIIRKCVNLRLLSVHFRDDGLTNVKKNQMIFKVIAGQENRCLSIIHLDVSFIPAYRTCHWTIKFRDPIPRVLAKDELEVCTKVSTPSLDPTLLPTPEHLHLNFEHYAGFDAMSYSKTRFFWKTFMEQQVHLRVLTCNFGAVCWDVYAQVIRTNAKTLEKVCLNQIGCWDFWETKNDGECPFNWNIFGDCGKLVYLSIGSEFGPRFGPIVYKPLSPCTMNICVLQLDFGIVYWRIYASIVVMNCNTLEDVSLLRLTSWDKTNNVDSPFDWRIFADCENLRSLVIGGEHDKFMETINFGSIPVENLRVFQSYWVDFTSEDMIYIVNSMLELENDFEFLNFCTIDKVYRGEGANDLVEHFRNNQEPFTISATLRNVKRVVTALPLAEIIATTWLFLVQPDA